MMEGSRVLRNSQIIILGICIAAATIVSSVILSQGFLKVMKSSREVITVTGSAHKDIRSDYIVWKCSFAGVGADLGTAYRQLNRDLSRVKQYLDSKGVKEEEETISQISIITVYKKNDSGKDTNEILGYRLEQTVEIRSGEVDKITGISRQSSELINEGIEFVSGAPEYFYTKLDDLKIEMLASASKNAKQRAENMVKATGNRIGLMRSARMGVFQITPLNSTEVSDWGVNDTSSLEKKVIAVVSASFAIE
ncbi:MAG: SIMPL domain-containing protein [Candidatus Omnitrophota bacterium]|jgi:hypothetical protein